MHPASDIPFLNPTAARARRFAGPDGHVYVWKMGTDSCTVGGFTFECGAPGMLMSVAHSCTARTATERGRRRPGSCASTTGATSRGPSWRSTRRCSPSWTWCFLRGCSSRREEWANEASEGTGSHRPSVVCNFMSGGSVGRSSSNGSPACRTHCGDGSYEHARGYRC